MSIFFANCKHGFMLMIDCWLVTASFFAYNFWTKFDICYYTAVAFITKGKSINMTELSGMRDILLHEKQEQRWLSYDQLWATSLIGRNAVTWHWALSYVHRFTISPFDIIVSDIWHYNVERGDVTCRSLNANVRYILRCFRFRSVCFFNVLL